MATAYPIQGGCACGGVRYQLLREPLIAQACHCPRCQRETGSAFAFNAMVETANIELLPESTQPVTFSIPGEASHGQESVSEGQDVIRCPKCSVAVWSHYKKAPPGTSFLRVLTLDSPAAVGEPAAHVWTKFKQPWVKLPCEGEPKVWQTHYGSKIGAVWSPESLQRMGKLTGAGGK